MLVSVLVGLMRSWKWSLENSAFPSYGFIGIYYLLSLIHSNIFAPFSLISEASCGFVGSLSHYLMVSVAKAAPLSNWSWS